jgi:hypothetical protein
LDPVKTTLILLPLPARFGEMLDNTGAGFVAVALNVTGLPFNPVDVAVTLYVPAMLPSVNTVEACPLLLVVVVVVLKDCPLAPVGVDEMAKLTVTPDIGLPPASVAVTTKGVGRIILTAAV